MPAKGAENKRKHHGSDDIVTTAREYLTTLSRNSGIRQLITEGEQIAEIVKPLNLPQAVLAAVHVYPLAREGVIDKKTFENSGLQSISRYVIGLEQLNQFSLPENWQPGEALAVQQSEALRKMLLAVVSDVRLVLVRIAEQLHRLRLARNETTAVQRSLALEAREIYAPLANRLGVWQLKWELEDYAFRYRDAEHYLGIAKALNEKRAEREQFIDTVKSLLLGELKAHAIAAEISGRPKHIYSIWRKMQRKQSSLETLHDIRAVRILVDDIKECYAALGVVHNLWSYLPGEFDDYIANPKENGYRSLHTAIIGPQGKSVEIQIRSHDMHKHAELGIAAHWRYKEDNHVPAAFDQKIQFLRQLLEPGDSDADLLEQVRDNFFEDRVYAISPKGDIVELTANATSLDFAYHVHTQIGHRCRGAKINGRIVPLTRRIENGDQIEIITGSQPQPSRDWLIPKLGYLAGARARAKVRHWFRHQDRDQHLRQGRDILDRELSRLNEHNVSIEELAGKLKHKDGSSLCIALGAGELTSASIASALHNLKVPLQRGARTRRAARQTDRAPDSTSISGVGNLLCNFARCCRPVPPEPIIGYITQGRGVSIHRQDCGNFLGLNRRSPERVLEISWGESKSSGYPVDVTLRAFDRNGLIRDITSVIADENANVLDLKSHTDKKSMQVIMELRIEIKDLPTLSTTINRLQQLANVVSVRRKA